MTREPESRCIRVIIRRTANIVFVDHQGFPLHGHYPLIPGSDLWIDPLTDRHNPGANLSFVDGHAEHWKWRSPKPKQERHCDVVPANGAGDLSDLTRLCEAVPK